MLCLMRERGVIPDRIQFADVGHRDIEKPGTYEHIDRMGELCLKWWGVPIEWVHAKSVDATLETACLKLGTLPAIVFGFKTCSQRWKLEPQKRALAGWFPGETLTRAIGLNADEVHRVKDYDDGRERSWFPLVEWGVTRRMVREVCLDEFGYLPVKSACFFCPSSKKSEVLALRRDHPALFDRAIAMERNALDSGKLGSVRGLGRDWSWEDLVVADDQQFKLFSDTVATPCMCLDGDDGEESQD